MTTTWTDIDEKAFRALKIRRELIEHSEALKLRCTENFREFVREAWHIVEPSRAFLPNWHIDAICDHLQAVTQGQIKRLLINIPPGYAKSLLVSVLWPAWVWSRDPKHRFLCASYADELSLRDAVRCRTLVESPWFRETFQPAWKLKGDQNVKGYYENTKSGFRISLSVGGKGTGFRADAQIIDDPLNAKDQFSDAALEDCVFWLDNVMSSRFNDQDRGTRVIVMQRLSERDLSGHVLEQGGYEHLCLPSEFEPERRCTTSIGFADPRNEPGELLFPALFPQHVLDQAKADMGSSAYAGQHQQRPVPAGGGMLKDYWWQYWQPKGANLPPVPIRMPDGNYEHRPAVSLPADLDVVIQSWDMAFKGTVNSDFVVGLTLAARGANRFVLDMERGRFDLPNTIMAVRRLSGRRPDAQTKLVESKANGPAVVQSLRHEIGGFVEVEPSGGKEARAAAASPMLEAGNWYLPHPAIAPWVPEFIAELAAFPAGTHDDCVDAWSQGAKRLIGVEPKRPKTQRLLSRAYEGPRGWMA